MLRDVPCTAWLGLGAGAGHVSRFDFRDRKPQRARPSEIFIWKTFSGGSGDLSENDGIVIYATSTVVHLTSPLANVTQRVQPAPAARL